jgi:hypothetical protein
MLLYKFEPIIKKGGMCVKTLLVLTARVGVMDHKCGGTPKIVTTE